MSTDKVCDIEEKSNNKDQETNDNSDNEVNEMTESSSSEEYKTELKKLMKEKILQWGPHNVQADLMFSFMRGDHLVKDKDYFDGLYGD